MEKKKKLSEAESLKLIQQILQERDSITEQSGKEAVTKFRKIDCSNLVDCLGRYIIHQDNEINELQKFYFRYRSINKQLGRAGD
jgi:hypothetical protein